MKSKTLRNIRKSRSLFFLILGIAIAFCTISCGGDDDICLAGEATPRMKIKFKSPEGKLKTLDSLYVGVEYDAGKITPLFSGKNVDSLFIPLKVNDDTFTQVYFKTSSKGKQAEVTIKYTPGFKYVSPACGIKRLYQNLDAAVTIADPVLGVEKNQTEIINEDKTHLYLIF